MNGVIERDVRREVKEFVLTSNIRSVKELKVLKEWVGLSDEFLKNKIYQRVYYLQNKSKKVQSSKSYLRDEGSVELGEDFVSHNDLPQNFLYKQKIDLQFVMKTILIISILLFLMNESRLFYVSYGFSGLNSYLLPVLVEACILMLSAHKSARGKTLMISLIIYNIISFSFYTVRDYEKQKSVLDNNKQVILKIEIERASLINDRAGLKEELKFLRSNYQKSYNSKFISRANNLYLPKIEAKEASLKSLNSSIEHMNRRIQGGGVDGSGEVLFIGCISLIFLKVVLQLVLILLLKLYFIEVVSSEDSDKN